MLEELTIYREISGCAVIRALSDGDRSRAIGLLAAYAEENGVSGDIFARYLAEIMARDDNVFSKTAELTGGVGESLKKLALKDLEIIKACAAAKLLPNDYAATVLREETEYEKSIGLIAEALKSDAQKSLEALMAHYSALGRGVSAKYRALRFNGANIIGIEKFDTITMDELIGIEQQKRVLVENTERFLQKRGANHIILFGDSGMGKSSLVKAIVNRYHGEGLRLVELRKENLDSIEKLLGILSESRHRYIVFMDDLSFEEGELGYKSLKAALEGKAAVTPDNVLFYATSNRRHLVRETWADRAREREEVRISDTVQEKFSLSERFGIVLVFSSLTQAQYLDIVAYICRRRGIEFNDEVKKLALQWEITYNGRSGRTARQFVDSITK